MLLGNKCEMDDKRKVSKERGEQIAEKFAVSFLEISAKKNLNIEEVSLLDQNGKQNMQQMAFLYRHS